MEQPPNDIEITPPSDFPLLENEQVISTVVYPFRVRNKHPSSLQQMLRLTRSKRPEDIGLSGPSVAALSFESDEIPDHLRLYETVFGRDSLRVAIDLIPSYPGLARATLIELAKLQGIDYHINREEEPGRIVHEARSADDPIAIKLTKELGWGWPYYGSVDATPEFVRTLTAYTQKSEENREFLSEEYIDRSGQVRTISYALDMALKWIADRRKQNTDGLVEYHSILPRGIENQVWKDSWDAYHHADGSLANHNRGIASIEVQVTTYDALIDAAELFEDVFDDPERAKELRAEAAELKNTILRTFWTDEKGGYFVLGTDRDDNNHLRQLKVRTSNMGHVLNSRILKGDDPDIINKRESIVSQLSSPELLTPAGIRTLASDEVRYRAGAYHCGSVWLWDTHHIAKGLRRLGYAENANDLDRRLLQAVNDTLMFPEYVRGDSELPIKVNSSSITLWDNTYQRENKVEQPPQEVQAWTVAAILAIKKRLSRNNIQ